MKWWTRISVAGFSVLVVATGCGTRALPAAADGNSTAMLPPGSPCAVEGATSSCHVVTGVHDTYVDCFNGVQTCQGGTWGPCQGGAGGGTLSMKAYSGPGLGLASLGPSSSSASACVDNPCNPNCKAFDENPATPVKPAVCSSAVVAAAMTAVSYAPYWKDEAIGCTSSPDDCYFGDNCCVVRAGAPATVTAQMAAMGAIAGAAYTGAAKVCIPASTTGATCTGTCNAQADFTAPPSCQTSDTNLHQSVCNRGKAVSAGTLNISITERTATMSKTGCASETAYGSVMARCQVDLSVRPLAVNACTDIDITATIAAGAAGINGVKCQKVGALPFNRDIAVQLNSGVDAAGAGGCGSAIAECNQKNNWGGASYSAGAYPSCPAAAGTPQTYTQTYTMDCPAGTRGRWGQLAYNASASGGATVAFGVRTGATTTGPWSPAAAGPPPGVVIATAPTDHPQICSMTGPSPCGGSYPGSCSCPLSLQNALSDAEETSPVLELNALFTPSCNASSTLNGGEVFGNSPGGFIKKGACGFDAQGNPGTGCKTVTGCANTQPVDHVTKWDACQFDFYCDDAPPNAVDGICKRFGAGDKWPLSVCPVGAGPDLTVAATCKYGGVDGFPICNRGNDDVPANAIIEIAIDNGNKWYWPTAAGGAAIYKAPDCSYTQAAPIKPGQCVFITAANSGCNYSGNAVAYVNSRQRIKECGMVGWSAAADYTLVATPRPTGNTPGASNNAADVKTGNSNGACDATVTTVTEPTLSGWDISYSCEAYE